MISDYLKKTARSFKYAFSGMKELIWKESNTRIHLFFTAAVIIAGFVFRVSPGEWCVLVLTIASVWSAEAINTAVERAVDLETREVNPLARAAKDTAAASVLIHAIASVVIGLIIFLPKLIGLFLY